MKLKLIFIGIIILASTLITTINAQSGSTGFVDQPTTVCPDFIMNRGNALKANFYNYLEAQSESAEQSSNRIGNIFSEYRDFQAEFGEVTGQTFLYSESTEGSSTLMSACNQYHQQTMAVIEEVLLETYEQILVRKQLYQLNERFDLILDEMDEMQNDFHNARSNMNEFHDKLTCFVSQCIGSQ